MGKGKTSKYDLKTAKELYMSFKPPREIAETMDMPYKTLMYHIAKWKDERSLMRNELLRELTENKSAILSSLVGNSLECLDRAIADLKHRGTPPTIKEARWIANIVTELDKIVRLDEGTPTDIIAEHKPSTIIELKDKLKRDPFYLEDANYREITNEKTTTNPTSDVESSNERDKGNKE